MNGFKIGGDNVVLDDDVSGSSTSYHYIYYSQDSWNYRGACLYSCGEFISSSGLLAYDYPNVSAYNLDILHGRHASPIILSLGYHSGSKMIVLSTNSNSVAKYDMSISILYDGVVNGYVQTHPKGTWYAAQDNYCTVEIAHTSVGLPLKTNASFVFADDRKINEAIAGVYEFSYLDSPKPLGADSYYHRAHPVDLNLSVSLGVEGDEKNELYPVKASWSTSVIEYYHQQDDTNYKCSLDVDIECFKVVVVSRK